MPDHVDCDDAHTCPFMHGRCSRVARLTTCNQKIIRPSCALISLNDTCLTKNFPLICMQVSSWVTHLIVSPPSHEERKAVLSCLIRTAVFCWNLGNFHGATEIIVGLR